MGIGHRDNHATRKNTGPEAFAKKAKQKQRPYIGPWNVTFRCGQTDYHPLARSSEIATVAAKAHHCQNANCVSSRFERLA